MTNDDYQIIFHEIKNNITYISGSLQLLEKAYPKISSYSYWNDAMQEVLALKKMLIELSSARLCNDLSLQKCSIEGFLSDLKKSYLSALHSENFCWQLEIAPSLPEISIDTQRLKRALFNLLKNSYEAMDGNGTIRLNVYLDRSFLRLDLIDHGGGIAPEYLPKLFTPLETTKTGGTGLGLIITRQIIEAHGGRLAVDSRFGDGCTFSIYLPCEHTPPECQGRAT